MSLFNFVKNIFEEKKPVIDREIYLYCERKIPDKNNAAVLLPFRMYAINISKNNFGNQIIWQPLSPEIKLKNPEEKRQDCGCGSDHENFYDKREKITVWEMAPNFIKFKNEEEINNAIRDDNHTRTMIGGFNFFTSENDNVKNLDMESFGFKKPDMLKHSFKSKPITKEDPRYKELKVQLFDKEKTQKIKSVLEVEFAAPIQEDLEK